MTNPEMRLLCSTGTMVSRLTNYDYEEALRQIRVLVTEGVIYGGELMMLTNYYPIEKRVISCIAQTDIPVPVIHCEKDVGTALSHAAVLTAKGDKCSAEKLVNSLLDIFRVNCRFGKAIGAHMMVLHLWSGLDSDSNIEFNISYAPILHEIAAKYSLSLLFETIPCTTNDPLTNLKTLHERFDAARFTYDTRLTALHGQELDFLESNELSMLIRHVHVSDFIGNIGDFSALRPIYHPGKGQIDFEEVGNALRRLGYNGYITLESPIDKLTSEGTTRLRSSFEYIRRHF